jgi:carbon-monoxide dehydrogenase large subunit
VGLRGSLSDCLGIAPDRLRVITRDVGGSFAVKIWAYPEQALALIAARETGQTVRWASSRIDSFGADVMGRARVDHARLATDENGKFLAFSLHSTADMGAFLNSAAPVIVSEGSMRTLGGVYDIAAMTFTVDAMFTNAMPTDAYRGAGKPESNSTLERLIDVAAYQMNWDRLDVRARNFIGPKQMPFKSAVGITYDAGNFPDVGAKVIASSDWTGFETRQQQSKADGKLRGIGISYYLHVTGGSPNERSEIRAMPDGTILVRTGTQDSGQGHRTALAMVASEAFEIPIDRIRVEQGDSDWLEKGGGTGGSNLMPIAGNNVHRTALQVIEQGKEISAELLEAAPADIQYTAGVFRIAGTDRELTLAQVSNGFESLPEPSRTEPMGLGCAAQVDFDDELATVPNGGYVCEVEVDPQTGAVSVERFTCVDDLGRVLNPVTVDGQLHGGIAQSIGEALMEGMRYDESGQILTGSLMDYALPRADDVPMMQLSKAPTDSPNSRLGVKGVGEVASIGAPGAVMNAVHHALRPFGVEHIDIPLTSEKVWQAMQKKG